MSAIEEVTQEAAERDPLLRADATTATEGVIGDGGDIVVDVDGAAISSHQRRALALALSEKGVRERPPGSNDNKYSRYFGFGPQSWCADFIAYCVDMTGNRDRVVPWGYPSSVRNITAWGRRNGTIHDGPRAGDIFTRKDGMHAGFVVGAQGTRFTTIEGNTSGPGGDYYVASHTRDAADGLYVFVRDDLTGA